MTPASDPNEELHRPTDPAQLGADQGPGSTPEDDSHDFSSVMAQADGDPSGDGPRAHTPGDTSGNLASGQLGSDFDELRRQGASGTGDRSETVGSSDGQGRAGFNGDEDRGYDQSGHHGGLGTSGGLDTFADRNFDIDNNPFTGGYSGGDYSTPEGDIAQRIGMNSQNPTDDEADFDAPTATDSSNS